MRVCILYSQAGEGSKLLKFSQALAKGIESQGHIVDLININLESNKRVSAYDYVCLGSEASKFFGGAIPSKVDEYLKKAGSLSGKRCMAFVAKKGLRNQKTLAKVMQKMESQGMYLLNSAVFSRPDTAEAFGTRLKITRD